MVCIRPNNFEYSEGDCMSKWLEAGRAIENYKYNFAITHCTNPEMDGTEPEVQALLATHGNTELYQRALFLKAPEDYNNHNRAELRNNGETSATWQIISSLIGVR